MREDRLLCDDVDKLLLKDESTVAWIMGKDLRNNINFKNNKQMLNNANSVHFQLCGSKRTMIRYSQVMSNEFITLERLRQKISLAIVPKMLKGGLTHNLNGKTEKQWKSLAHG